jgi:integrase/recombinase XerD
LAKNRKMKKDKPMQAKPNTAMNLYTPLGQRKYINSEERARFLTAAALADVQTQTLCMTLAYTGCRISEALELKVSSVQSDSRIISFRSLKKRNHFVMREIPVPQNLIDALETVHNVSNVQRNMSQASTVHLWPWGRTWAWERVKAVMSDAGITGTQATPKGLRHGFGIQAVQSSVPLNLVQKWLGHAQLSTTAIYANAIGPEEAVIAMRMWGSTPE